MPYGDSNSNDLLGKKNILIIAVMVGILAFGVVLNSITSTTIQNTMFDHLDRNYQATIIGTKHIFEKSNERGNQTIDYFNRLINVINDTTARLEKNDKIKFEKLDVLADNDKIKFEKLNGLASEIRNDTNTILQFQKNQSASKFQGERNYAEVQKLENLTHSVLDELAKLNQSLNLNVNGTA